VAPRPFCLCLAGPNGSGKSTITSALKRRFRLQSWIDPDEVATRLQAEHGADSINDEISYRAFAQARNFRVAAAEDLHDFAFETVFSHGSNLKFIRALRMAGYEVHLYFVSTDNEEVNVRRVRNRVAKGGHSVPENKIRERYRRSMMLMALAIRECEQVYLFDNSIPLTERAPGQLEAGRLVGVIRNDAEGIHPEQVLLNPPVPAWVTTYAVPPFSRGWQSSELCKAAVAIFGDDIYCSPTEGLDRAESRRRFFRQFSM
jgi:predicted ABC-type ATPase